MRVRIDEAGSDHETVGVDHTTRRLVERTDGDDVSIAYTYVSSLTRRSGTVDDVPSAKGDVEHARPLLCYRSAVSQKMPVKPLLTQLFLSRGRLLTFVRHRVCHSPDITEPDREKDEHE